MSWNYRVVKRTHDTDTDTFALHACYDENNEPRAITRKPIYVLGTTLEELKEDYDMQRKAFEKPILTYEDF